jgi:hypothetical protein
MHKLYKSIAVTVTLIISSVFFYKCGTANDAFNGDALGYYLYLPETFIYHNLKTPEQLPAGRGIQELVMNYTVHVMPEWRAANGRIIDQYTYGVAFFELPFFLAAHAYETAKGAMANGFSHSYIMAVKISTIFYVLLGLILVYKILKRYFPGLQALLGTLAVFMGTNLFWFTLRQAGMSHTLLFFLYALLIYLTIKVHELPKRWHFIVIGFICGMVTIIRPTDLVCVFIPLLYNVYDRQTIAEKVAFIKQNAWNVLLLIIAFIIPFIPQLIYWKVMTGHCLYYSYGNQSFDWKHPKIVEGLFYFANGWLPYSPVMIFALLGLLLLRNYKKWAWSIWVIVPLYVYAIYSWYCYRYINGLGSRPMLHLYPLLAIPLTGFIVFISQKKVRLRAAFLVVCLFFVSANLSFSVQQANYVLWSEESNMQANLQLLYRTRLTYNDMVVADIAEWQPDTAKLVKLGTLGCQDFDDSLSDHNVCDTVFGSKYMYRLRDQEIKEAVVVKFDAEKYKDARWLKCSGWFMYPQFPDYGKHMLVLDIDAKVWKGCKIENKVGSWSPGEDRNLFYSNINTWGYIYYFVRIPRHLDNGHQIKLFLWNLPKTDLYMDHLCLEAYK